MTLSPRRPVHESEQLVRGRLARDGAARVAAKTDDRSQVTKLRRLLGRLLLDDDDLRVWFSEHPDGVTYLTVAKPGADVSFWGDLLRGD